MRWFLVKSLNSSRKLTSSSKIDGKYVQITLKCSLKTGSSGPKASTCDWVGPPDPDSNIRPYKLHQPTDESPAERKLREFREDTFKFNQEFWSKHNKNFSKSKNNFISTKLIEHKKQNPEKPVSKLSPEELSEFYRKFLDHNYSLHRKYIRQGLVQAELQTSLAFCKSANE